MTQPPKDGDPVINCTIIGQIHKPRFFDRTGARFRQKTIIRQTFFSDSRLYGLRNLVANLLSEAPCRAHSSDAHSRFAIDLAAHRPTVPTPRQPRLRRNRAERICRLSPGKELTHNYFSSERGSRQALDGTLRFQASAWDEDRSSLGCDTI